jgi:hypothetical protein
VLGLLEMAVQQRFPYPQDVQRRYADFVVGMSAVVAHECRARVPHLEMIFVQGFRSFVGQPPVAEYAAVCSLLRGEWERLLRTSGVNKDGYLDFVRKLYGRIHLRWRASDRRC